MEEQLNMGILAHPMFLQKYYGLSRLRSLLTCKKKALVVDDETDTRKVLVLFPMMLRISPLILYLCFSI
jgi:hypothetical protein